MENKRKHLEFVQDVITRMANTSFLLKGWSITVLAGLFALSTTQEKNAALILAIVLAIIFWLLDSFFLWQERMFRRLYDEVRQKEEGKVDFSMDASRFTSVCKWYKTPFSITLWPFYLSVLGTLVTFLILKKKG